MKPLYNIVLLLDQSLLISKIQIHKFFQETSSILIAMLTKSCQSILGGPRILTTPLHGTIVNFPRQNKVPNMPILSKTLEGHKSETVRPFELKFFVEMYYD
jgi:hypothetical protein